MASITAGYSSSQSTGSRANFGMESSLASLEDTETLLRQVEEDGGLRKDALDSLIRAARRSNGRLAHREPLALFHALALALRDSDWEVRNKAVALVTELVPKYGAQLVDCMAILMPALVACLADAKVANRRATTQCLHVYMKAIGDTEPILRAIIRHGLESPDADLQRNVCVSVPVLLTPDLAGGDFSQLVTSLARCLTSKDEATANAALHALEAIRATLGHRLFAGYVQQLNPPLRRYYCQVSGHQDPGALPEAAAAASTGPQGPQGPQGPLAPPGAQPLSRSPSMQRRPIPGLDAAGGQQAQPADLAFGCVPRALVAQLDEQEDYSLRAHAVEELRALLRQMDAVEPLVPHLERFLGFLHSLLDDSNFRVAIVTLDILYLMASRLGPRLAPHVRAVLAALTKQMSDAKVVVRQAVLKLAILLMQNHKPQAVLGQLLDNLEHRNSRVRQETLNVTIAALVTFPSSDFDLGRLCACVAPSLLDPKRQVRHAALEVMALLAQSLGSGRLLPLQSAVRQVETRPEGAGLFEAVMTRLSKRQLPRLNAEGLVEYAIPVPSSATRRYPTAPNEEWVLQGSSGAGSSAKSRPELVDLEADGHGGLTDRRRSSAGKMAKGKLPWEDADAAQKQQPKLHPHQHQHQQQQQQQHQPQQQQQQQQPQQKQQEAAASSGGSSSNSGGSSSNSGGSSSNSGGQVANGRVKRLADIPTEPRRIKRFLDPAERSASEPTTQEQSAYEASAQQQQQQQQQPAGTKDNEGGAIPLKPQLARSAGKRPKRPDSNSNAASDSGISLATAASALGNQAESVSSNEASEVNGSLSYIRHSASKKKALKVFENAESSSRNTSRQNSQDAEVEAATSATTTTTTAAAAAAAGGSSSSSRHNPHQGATFRSNTPYRAQVVGRGFGDEPEAAGAGAELGRQQNASRGRQHRRGIRGLADASSPHFAHDRQDSPDSDFNIVGRGMLDAVSSSSSPAAADSRGRSRPTAAVANSPPPAVLAKDNSAAYRDYGYDDYRVGEDQDDEDEEDEEDEDEEEEEDEQQQQQQERRRLQRALSNTLRESVAQRRRQKAERLGSGSSGRDTRGHDDELIRQLREEPQQQQQQQQQQKQQQQQQQEESIDLAALRDEQLAISKKHSEGIGSDLGDLDSFRGSAKNSALASLNRKVSDKNFGDSRPPAPRRNMSKPPRPTPAAAVGGAGRPAAEEPVTDAGPLASPERAYQDAFGRLQDADWQAKCDGLQMVQRLCAHHPDVAAKDVHALTLAVVAEVKNLRSQVSRLAIQTLGDMLGHLGRRMDTELDTCAKVLLQKAGESNKFIQEDTEAAVLKMVDSCNPNRTLTAIIQVGAGHKNMQVRRLAAQTLCELCDRMGAGRLLSGVKDVTDRVLPAAAGFCLDSNQETRYWGRRMLHPLLGHQDFEPLLNKHVSPATMRSLKEVVENLRLKGVGEAPASNISAGSRSRRGTSAGSADSGLSGSTFYSSQSAPSTGGLVRKANANSRLSDAAADQVKAACQLMAASNWQERLQGIDQLVELSEEKPDLVGQCIVKFMDVFAPRLADSNSKVQQHALEAAQSLIPNLRHFLAAVANVVVRHAAPVLSSKSAETARSASLLLDAFVQEIDSEKLVQPMVQAVATANARSKPELVEKLATLTDKLAARKPKLAQLHVEPELFRLLSGLSPGAQPLKASAFRLAQVLHRHGGPELLDRARAQNCTPRALQLLDEALR